MPILTFRAALQGTVLIRNAEELQGYSRGEEDKLEAVIRSISEAGVGVIVSGAAIGEIALHFIEKYKILAIRIPSKFDLRRFCRYRHTYCFKSNEAEKIL